MVKLAKVVAYALVFLIIIILGAPKVARWLGWRPSQVTPLQYKNSQLGISVADSLRYDGAVWRWRKSNHDRIAGIFLEISKDKDNYIAFAYGPASEDSAEAHFAKLMKNGRCFSNISTGVRSMKGSEWVEPASFTFGALAHGWPRIC